jgi:succinoglycan biosynthesis transport protein ExoP
MDVRDVGVALWRQRPLVVLILVVTGAAVAVGLVLAPKSYTATATVSAARSPSASSSDDADAWRETLAAVANTRAVVDEVRSRLRARRDADELRRSIQVHWVRGTTLLEVTVVDRAPETAAEIANTVAAVLVEGEATATTTGPSPNQALVLTPGDRAEPPQTFSRPDWRAAIGFGLLFALGLCVVGAVYRDRRTHTVDDAVGVEEAAGAPVLAHLAPPHDVTGMPALHPGTAEADLFRHLRIAVEAAAQAGGTPRLVVAGVTGNDVHVWIGANIAISLACTGRRVLLVDGRMGERFGTPVERGPDTPGLYDVLLGADLETAMSPGPVDLLQVLPAGTWGDEPISELLAQRFVAVMEVAAAEFDHVVVLGPPLEACDDARVMAVGASLVLAVVESSVSAGALHAHADRVRAIGARLLGVVLVGRQPARAAA